MTVDVVVLAAGKGSRMKSALPKVLHTLAGKPLLAHVLDTARELTSSPIAVVVGHGAEQVRAQVTGYPINWVLQADQLGTGHAVQQALPILTNSAVTLVLYGDVPMIKAATLRDLIARVSDNSMALLTVEMEEPTGYGRIIRDDQGAVIAIVEQKDASAEQCQIREINTGVMAFPPGFLASTLHQIQANNAQGEYYLTDLVALARTKGIMVNALKAATVAEIEGVNSRAQLHSLERYLQRELAGELQAQGVGIADVARFDCRGELVCGEDCFIDVNVVFEGKVTMGDRVTIGPNCVIADAIIGNDVAIKANTVIEGPVVIEQEVDIGPFARLRPGTRLRSKSRIGNFVETKKSDIGCGSKVNHLSYIGDTQVGENANIGAGTITCNYDGVNKFKTVIGDNAFIGSNSSLVAPVTIGANATVGAGSAISKDVADEQLAIARGRQRNIDHWPRPTKREQN